MDWEVGASFTTWRESEVSCQNLQIKKSNGQIWLQANHLTAYFTFILLASMLKIQLVFKIYTPPPSFPPFHITGIWFIISKEICDCDIRKLIFYKQRQR